MIKKISSLVLLLAFVFPPAAPAIPPIERSVLPNGLVLIVCEERSLPSVTMQLLIEAGSRRDPPQKGGLAYLTAKSVLMGSPGRDITAIQEELDFLGASLESWAAQDYAVFGLKILRKDLERGFGLLMDQLTRPAFPATEIERERRRIMAAIRSAEDEPLSVAEKEFQKNLHLDFAYGHPAEGTEESVRTLTREDIRDFYGKFYHPNNGILVIAGDVTAEEVRKLLVPPLAALKKQDLPAEEFRGGFAKSKNINIDKSTAQASIVLGKGGVSRENPDYYALTVMNYILGGGGFGSRLFEEVRVKKGLAYSVDSAFIPAKKEGSFQVVLQTKNSTAREAIGLVLREIRRIRENPVTAEELNRAKAYLVGSFPLRLDTQGKLARFLTQVEYFRLGPDYPDRYPSIINAVTAEDVQRVARQYLDAADYVTVIVGNVPQK